MFLIGRQTLRPEIVKSLYDSNNNNKFTQESLKDF